MPDVMPAALGTGHFEDEPSLAQQGRFARGTHRDGPSLPPAPVEGLRAYAPHARTPFTPLRAVGPDVSPPPPRPRPLRWGWWAAIGLGLLGALAAGLAAGF